MQSRVACQVENLSLMRDLILLLFETLSRVFILGAGLYLPTQE